MEVESFEEEIDLDEEVAEEELEEATNFSKQQSAKNDSSSDNKAFKTFASGKSVGGIEQLQEADIEHLKSSFDYP